MKLIFDSMDELRSFMSEVDGDGSDDAAEAATGTKGRRGRGRPKAEPAAAGVPANPATGFAPPPNAASGLAGFPSATGPAAAPTTWQAPSASPVHPLVPQIIDKTEKAIVAGQPLEAVVGWFRSALGPESAQANWEQMKAAFLPKASEHVLKQIAHQLGIPPQA